MSGRAAAQANGQQPAAELGRILMVEPAGQARSEAPACLESRGFRVARATDLAAAALRLGAERIEVAILDGGLGVAAVLSSCGALSRLSSLIVLAGEDAQLGLAALDAGADDFLCAPHNPREVLARVRALLRRRRRSARAVQRRLSDTLVLHPEGRILAADGVQVAITPTQQRVLEVLCARRGEVVPRLELFVLVYGEASELWDRAIDVQVSRLRKRLAQLGAADLISARRGVGYRLAG